MRALLVGGLMFVAIGVAVVIGSGVEVLTKNTVLNLTNNDTSINAIVTANLSALTTFSSMLPIVALGLVGGYAIYYVVSSFLGGQMGGGR